MNLINNRYRVLKNIKQNHLVSAYLVADVKRGHKVVQLNIINSEYLPDALLNFYTKEFVTLTTVEDDNIVALYDFGIIQLIDNKKMDKQQYFYVNENIETDISFMNLVKNTKKDNILDLFVIICQSINYLHLRGFVYGDITIDNIYVNGLNIKLKDLATIELEKYDYWSPKNNKLIFKPPEFFSGSPVSVSSDIYSLGVLLLFMCRREIDENVSVSKQLLKLKSFKEHHEGVSAEYKDFINKIIPIMQKMLEHNINKRYKNINEVIESINQVFNIKYKAYNKEQLEKLNFKTQIVGRDYEINNVLNIYNSMIKLDIQGKFIVVHGEYGIGKTKFLKELEHRLLMRSVNIYSSFNLDSSASIKNKGFYEIIRKIIGECNEQVIERYEGELVRIIPELGNKKKINPSLNLSQEKEKGRILSGICAFINDFMKGKPAVFIIDNIHMADDFSIEILEHMYLRNKNMMFIFSYCDGELIYNKRLVEFLTKISEKSNVIDAALHGLNTDDAVSMIQDILRCKDKPMSFGRRIFSKTYGNPLFIEETIKNLFAKKIIYIDEASGTWNSKYDYDYNKLPVPSDMEQAVLAQINGIDSTSLEILKVLSIFNTGIPKEILNDIIKEESTKLDKSINDLEIRGILCKKIEDRGFVYDFSNRILKNLIMDKLDEEYKRAKHELAASILEKEYDDGSDNKEELIYHLVKSGQKEKVIKYCLENADKMEALKNRTEAIQNLLKAVSMMEDDSFRKVKLLISIGSIYEDSGNIAKAIQFYNDAEKLAVNLQDYKDEIDSLNKISSIYFKKNDIVKTLEVIERTEEILSKTNALENYMEGYLECAEVQVRVYSLTQNYDKAKEICSRVIGLCTEKHQKLKGLFYKDLGNIYLENSKPEKALKCYKKAMVCFEKINYSEGIIISLNNIAVVYGDFYQDNNMTISYLLKMKEISEKNHFINFEVLATTNLAESYYYDWNYELAYQYFLDALEKSKSIEFESNVFYCYNYLCSINLRFGNYSEAEKYHLSAKKELENYPEHGKNIGVYYQIGAELYHSFGDRERAEEFIKKSLDIYKDDDSLQQWNSKILYEYINMYTKDDERDVIENISRIKKIMDNFKSPLKKLDIICDIAINLYQKNFVDLSAKLLEEGKRIGFDSIPSVIEAKYLFLRGALSRGNNKFKLLNSSLEIVKRDKDKTLYSKILYTLGNYYLCKKDYFYAVNYYFESSEVIKGLCLQIPKEYQVKFINSPGMITPFIMLMTMRKSENYRKVSPLDRESLLVNSTDELESLFDYGEFEDILNNKYFIRSAKKIYNSHLPKDIRNVKDIIKNLYADPLKNLEVIAKYLASVTLATKSLIIIDSINQSFYTIASYDGNNEIPPSKYIFEKVRATRESILLTEMSVDKNSSEFGYIPQGAKAVICVPIIMNVDDKDVSLKENKRRNTFINNPIKGYLYLESDRTLNNFNNEGLEKCVEISRLAGAIIEKYLLQIASSTDKLTGTLTRKFLEDALSDHIDRADDYNGIFSIIMMDLDLFKHINDRFGHQTGDEVLRKACSIIKSNIRKEDIVGRYGGEEFIIILPETNSNGAVKAAEKLRNEIEDAKILGYKTPVTVSMGIATYPYHAQWKQELIEKADQALYVSKELGRNRCTLWNSKFSSKIKGTNKLTGIVSGNIVQDSRNVLVMLDIIELARQDMKLEYKIFDLLGRIIEITESEYGMFFIIENGEIKEKYARKIFEEDWVDMRSYNKEIMKSVIEKKQGVYMTDWDETPSYDSVTGMPDWNSVAVTPLVKNNSVKGVIYLTVSTKKKEFKLDEFNFINTLGELAVAVL